MESGADLTEAAKAAGEAAMESVDEEVVEEAKEQGAAMMDDPDKAMEKAKDLMP